MSEEKIQKFEPLLHAFPFLYASGASIAALATKTLNPAGPICWIAPEPRNCLDDPELECLSTGNINLLKWFAGGIPVFLVFILNIIIMIVIWCEVRSQHNRRNVSRGEGGSEAEQCSSCCLVSRSTNFCRKESSSVLADRLSRPSRATIQRMKDISNRATAYIAAYLATFIFTAIYRIVEAYGGGSVPFAIVFLSRFFYPLQGFFNVLVYTHPHVVFYRRTHEGHNWFQAFFHVLKSGGDSDEISSLGHSTQASRRRESIRKKQRVLEQSEQRVRSPAADRLPGQGPMFTAEAP